ncbi:MAG: N-acetyltransferase family protein [Betaproteobacteria bacterium]
MVEIARVASADDSLHDALCDLLADTVEGGASVGFVLPLTRDIASRYWRQVEAALADGLDLWVARSEGRVVGSVQLDPCRKPNAPHRAELMKLLVLRSHRGRGIARSLLAAAEAHARAAGRTLLVLDTERGSTAEAIYRHLGWHRAGEIPGYARTPHGKLHPTVYYYKQL